MFRTVRLAAALLFCALNSFAYAQTYSTFYWGVDTGATPNEIWANFNNTWKRVGYISGSGFLPSAAVVTQFSFVNANGFTGSVANPTTTPALTLGTSITGILKGNGTAISAATSGADYAPATSGTSILVGNGSGGFTAVGNLTTGLPLIGQGTGTPTQGTRSGNTTKFATSNGTLTNGNCVSLDASGNYVDAGGPCTVGGGGGTVTAGTAKQFAYYSATGSTVVGNATYTTDTVVAGGGTTVVLDIPTWSNTGGTALDDKGTNKAPALKTSAAASYYDGYLFRLPRMYSTVTPGGTHDHIFGEPSATVQPQNHSFIGCILCEFYTSAAGTTAFVGTDGTTTPIIGTPGGPDASNAHMTAFGPSVVCEGSEALCMGHVATATSANDIVIGRAKDTGVGSGSNILIGGTATLITGTGGQNIGIGPAATFSTTGSQNILLGNTLCTIGGAISTAIGIGRDACPSATGNVVIGGAFAAKFYAGAESAVVPVYASGVVSQGTAPSTNLGTCTLGTWTGGPWAGKFVSSGACATGGTYYWTATKTPPNGLACVAYDLTTPAATLAPVTGTNGNAIKLQVTSATSVANNDVITINCQAY